MTAPFRVKILGKCWTVVIRRLRTVYGDIDDPTTKGKMIRLEDVLRGEKLVTIVLHEGLHAADWHKDETWVDKTSTDLARIICKPQILERVLDCPKLLNSVKHVLKKHGYEQQKRE